MGTLLNRRRYMGGGSAPLPYDAEIEYLETSGTQWINTNYYPNTNTVIETKLFLVNIYIGSLQRTPPDALDLVVLLTFK